MSTWLLQTTLVLLSFAVIVTALIEARRTRSLREALSLAQQVVQDLTRAADKRLGIGEALVRVVDVVARLVEADSYYLYVREGRADTLVLRAVKSPRADPRLAPSYSGLASGPGDEEEYRPPLGLALESQPKQVSVVREQGDRMLAIPLWSGDALEAVIHAGPLRRNAARGAQLRTLSEFAPLCAGIVGLLAEREALKRSADESSAMSTVSATMMRSTFQGEAAMGLFLSLGSGIVGADAGMALVEDRPGEPPVTPACWGLPDEVRSRVARGLAAMPPGFAAMVGGPPGLVAEGDEEVIPEWLAAAGVRAVWVVPFEAERRRGAVAYCFRSPRSVDGYMKPMLEMISMRIASAVRNVGVYEEMLQSYLETLSAIVDLLDSREPSTVGHSRLIARYSEEIALAMGLPADEVRAISLAGFLHDIGMMGLGEGVLLKKGRLTPYEYESVKRHAQLGAMLVEPIARPLPIAPLIRHHHERYDGWGYPSGIRGEEIPLGARIIAVADAFNAKVSSRSYRRALPYERAMAEIRAAAGSQLDPAVVAAFVKTWEAKQRSSARRGRSLEDCWVMRQCPPTVSSACPAFRSKQNCWEVHGVKCESHGDECETCLVSTEYRLRQRKPQLRLVSASRSAEAEDAEGDA